jgi:large subunit ribosomal protein L13
MIKMIIDAQDLIAGRLATVAAEKVLLGEKVDIINSEKAVISGKKEEVIAKYKRVREMGVPRKGPFQPSLPDRFLRRIVKRMLPMAKPRGKEAFKNVMCYIGVPEQFKDKKAETIPKANAEKLPNLKKVTVGQICKSLGGNWND